MYALRKSGNCNFSSFYSFHGAKSAAVVKRGENERWVKALCILAFKWLLHEMSESRTLVSNSSFQSKFNRSSWSRPPGTHMAPWPELEELKLPPLHLSSSQQSQLCIVEVISEQTVATLLAVWKTWATRTALKAASGTTSSMPASKVAS